MTCKHTKTVEGHWTENTHNNTGISYADDEYYDNSEWVDEYERCTVVDVDIHHYKCTQCGKIMRY